MRWRKNKMSENKTINFKEELNRLNEIVDKISSKTLSLDESLKLYEEGSKIIKSLEKELNDAEKKVEKIIDCNEK